MRQSTSENKHCFRTVEPNCRASSGWRLLSVGEFVGELRRRASSVRGLWRPATPQRRRTRTRRPARVYVGELVGERHAALNQFKPKYVRRSNHNIYTFIRCLRNCNTYTDIIVAVTVISTTLRLPQLSQH